MKSSFKVFWLVLTQPRLAVQQDVFSKAALLPLGAIVIATILSSYTYFSNVDKFWLKQAILMQESESYELSNEEEQDIISIIDNGVYQYTTIIYDIGALLLSSFLMALFLFLYSSYKHSPTTFKSWWSNVLWAKTPMVLASIGSIVFVLSEPAGQVLMKETNILAFGNLIVNPEEIWGKGPFLALISGMTLTSLWSYGILAVTVRERLAMSSFTSVLTVLIPVVTFYLVVTALW